MIAIIGAGPAGVSVAETLRKYTDEPITIFSMEQYPPYNPAVLTTYLKTGGDELFWKGKDVLDRLKVDARLGEKVEDLDTANKKIITEKGEYGYDRLVIASGSRLYAPLKGLNQSNVYNFKSLTEVERLRSRLRRGMRAVVVGAGFQGTEIALTLSELGVDVTLVEAMDRIMPDRFDKKASKFVEDVLESKGVKVVFNTFGAEFAGDGNMCRAVVSRDGEEFEGDIFIAATGVAPNIDFCNGIETSKGIVVDDYMETSQKGVFACGDVCETRNRITGERGIFANYWNAIRQGRVVAYNILGNRIPYDGSDVINSLKKLGFHFIVAGDVSGTEYEEIEENGEYRRFYIRNGKLVGYMIVGDISNAGIFYRVMVSNQDVDKLKMEISELRDTCLRAVL